MDFLLFANIDQVFHLNKQNIKSTGKVGEFC